MKNIIIEFNTQYLKNDVYDYPYMYNANYNRVGIQNVKEVRYGSKVVIVEYKKSPRAKKTINISFDTSIIKHITIN